VVLQAERPSRADIVIAAVVLVITMAGSAAFDAHMAGGTTLRAHLPGHRAVLGRPLGVAGYLLVAATCAALPWRRSLPTPVLLWVFACVSVLGLTGYRVGPEYLPLIVAFFAAVTHGDRRVAYAVLAGGYLLSFARPVVAGRDLVSPTARLALAAWLLVLAAAAEITRIRATVRHAEAERTARTQEARQEQARRRAGEERLRIAQDLHDVLAHQLALITVQANAGLALLKNHQPGRASESLKAIKEAGNSALGELRSVLDTLRTDDVRTDNVSTGLPAASAARTPVPLLSRTADLTLLADGARAAGLAVDVRHSGREQPLPVAADRAAYRIIQEALTNAVRHAGPGTGVAVRIDHGDTVLRVVIDDDGRGSPPAAVPRGGGNGLPGMRERAEAVGGTLAAGPQAGGGYRVTATLPLPGGANRPGAAVPAKRVSPERP
jgi:signal transduction histidine kinase